MADFDDRKQAVLQGLASEVKDKSRAGGVDAPIAALIDRINWHPQYFTTSSCSGRISIFSESTPDDGGGHDGETATVGKKTKKKKGGDWVYVSHAPAVETEVRHSNAFWDAFWNAFWDTLLDAFKVAFRGTFGMHV